ncbi:MAG: LamG-like jellyroll fold domain-containing protein [Bacteroidota bacterium]
MKKLTLLVFLLLSMMYFAQDTTWVQTLTFDSIATRRGNFSFPQELNNKRFEKVLMYYKLKCSPLTPWDQYNCGEWDYLTYSRVFEHTGLYDSTEVTGNLFVSNFTSPASTEFNLIPFTQSDTYTRTENNRSGAVLTTQNINTMAAMDRQPFDVANNGGRAQYLILASELSTAGITAGNIESLTLYLSSFLQNGELKYPRISLKASSANELTSLQNGGFTEVYNASHWSSGSQADLVTGANEFLFYQPFAWNGTDNLVVEFYFENTTSTGSNLMLFEAENTSVNNAVAFSALNGTMQFNGSNQALSQLSDFYMGNEMTIAFWAKGTGSAGTNTSLLEAYDTLNNRIINLHFPWSDNNLYFDAGNGNGSYDRINKAMTVAEIDNNWNHWALVKNATAGTMQVYKNGVLWHSGTGKNMPVGYIHRLVLGTNVSAEYDWKGMIDEFQVYNAALSQADIQSWMNKKIDNTHPFWNNLLLYHDFDNKNWAEDMSQTDNKLMPSDYGMITFTEFPVSGHQQLASRPVIGFGQGTVSGSMTVSLHPEKRLKEPNVIFEYSPVNRHFDIVNARVGVLSGNETEYDDQNQVVSQTPFTGTSIMSNAVISYFQEPVERVHDIEIGRYITPYGIGFDLGPNGFTYVYDVTDYQQYLKNEVDLEAHNTQELIDLRFAFIEGIPPRDVHNRQPVWNEWRSYQYADMDNNNVLQAVNVSLSDTSDMFKIKTRFTGHGHNGSVNCCEWDSKDHMISINGTPRFNWEIWQESECGDNPNRAQGGTWPYAREGWCPGDMVKEHDHELTPFVTPGETVAIDYDIENVPANDLAQGNGNYIVAMDLISYSAPNFQHDAALVDVLNPNNYEYYKKFNPTCSYPRVILQNTGQLPLTQCVIRIYVEADKAIDFPWTGNLAFLQKEIVEIPVDDLTWWQSATGTHTFHAEIISVEGTADEYAQNNIKTTRFQSPEIAQGPFYVWFITNNKASENKYTLIKDNGDVIFQRLNMANQTHYKDTFDLDPGCYSIILEDSDHDGISFWYSSQVEGESSGSFMIRKVGGTTLETFPGDFGHYYRYNFSIGMENLSTEELIENSGLSIFPNPTNGEFYIDLGGKNVNRANLEITDISGRIILRQEMQAGPDSAEANVNLEHAPTGLYFVKVITGNKVYTEQIIKQ